MPDRLFLSQCRWSSSTFIPKLSLPRDERQCKQGLDQMLWNHKYLLASMQNIMQIEGNIARWVWKKLYFLFSSATASEVQSESDAKIISSRSPFLWGRQESSVRTRICLICKLYIEVWHLQNCYPAIHFKQHSLSSKNFSNVFDVN